MFQDQLVETIGSQGQTPISGGMAKPAGFRLVDVTMMYAPRSGGVKRYLLAKRSWLAAHRPDIDHTIVAPGARTQQGPDGEVSIAAARLPFGDGYRMPASPARWAAVIRQLAPDVIEAGDVFVPGLAALDAGQALGRPVVGFCHTDAAALAALHLGEWARAPARRQWAETFARFDAVVAPSQHMARRLAEAGVEDVLVQGLGVDIDLFHPRLADRSRLLSKLGLSQGARLLVFAGRAAREKNIDSMVEAVERLGDPYRLLLVGAGRDVRPSPQVIALDYVSDPGDLARLLASADAFLHANENEPFGLAVLEALASGAPVVGPRRGGVGELIDETVGQRAHTSHSRHLAEAIEALFARDLEAVSRAARLRAEQRHGWDATFRGLTTLYEDMAGTFVPANPLALSA
ncbi:glycosyltransferase [Phenylobacterium sp.]|uniref:glycosyltransferase n=1 Tax=Phenylobacterium sp. TaxID=1871053 RepID=UPI002730DE91|nr:glycosyltransferase [Phenylobacterium sp.]MDP2215196.1 glycosyltransferase [Phenylobacterium sp.]